MLSASPVSGLKESAEVVAMEVVEVFISVSGGAEQLSCDTMYDAIVFLTL